MTFKTLSFTTALVLASAVAYAQAPATAPAPAPAPQGPPPQPQLGPNEWNIDQGPLDGRLHRHPPDGLDRARLVRQGVRQDHL